MFAEARKKPQLRFENTTLHLFTDFLLELRRHTFVEVRKRLWEKGLSYGMLYPSKLNIGAQWSFLRFLRMSPIGWIPWIKFLLKRNKFNFLFLVVLHHTSLYAYYISYHSCASGFVEPPQVLPGYGEGGIQKQAVLQWYVCCSFTCIFQHDVWLCVNLDLIYEPRLPSCGYETSLDAQPYMLPSLLILEVCPYYYIDHCLAL